MPPRSVPTGPVSLRRQRERWRKHGDDGAWSQQALARREERGLPGGLGESCQLLCARGGKNTDNTPPPRPFQGSGVGDSTWRLGQGSLLGEERSFGPQSGNYWHAESTRVRGGFPALWQEGDAPAGARVAGGGGVSAAADPEPASLVLCQSPSRAALVYLSSSPSLFLGGTGEEREATCTPGKGLLILRSMGSLPAGATGHDQCELLDLWGRGTQLSPSLVLQLIEDLRKQLEHLQLFKLEAEQRRGRSSSMGLQEYNSRTRETELEQEIKQLKQVHGAGRGGKSPGCSVCKRGVPVP